MGIGLRVANWISLRLLGERLSPVTMPSPSWELSEPRIEASPDFEVLTLAVRDTRHPMLKGTVSIGISRESTFLRWRTRASGVSTHVRAGGVRISADGQLIAPQPVGRLHCSESETALVRNFLGRQRGA